ncbi:PaaI family thioesterase [uncultured Allofournierella sp.]|uniref:PaaI family thioesterase n=1 Tax=uncultured Allofournierella sp. TaxID=1940258 RepID=UPI0025F40ADC|nr:PaaI family thioesterase [uncultured Fournierella sp.]
MDKEKLLAFARARLRPVTCLDEIEVLACEPGLARLRAPVGEQAKNAFGNAHGGWLYTLCDSCSGLAACAGGNAHVTLQASMNYLAAGRPGDLLTVEAVSEHSGRHTCVNRVTITNQEGRLVATASFTMYRLDDKIPGLG